MDYPPPCVAFVHHATISDEGACCDLCRSYRGLHTCGEAVLVYDMGETDGCWLLPAGCEAKPHPTKTACVPNRTHA